jgi:hypothetical protein
MHATSASSRCSTREQFSRYLQEQRKNSAQLIRELGFQPR